MMRRYGFILGAAMLVALSVPTAAQAADDGYPPEVPTTPSLGGSTAVGYCDLDAPWIDYSVTLTDPNNEVTSKDVTLTLTDGSNSTAPIPLGTLVDNQLEGRVLWPGAEVDAAGNGTLWPGWAVENGRLVPTTGNFAWSRGEVTAVLEVNPELRVAIAYPSVSSECADPPASAGVGSLPATGVAEYVLPLGIAGGAAALAGAVLLIARRRTRDSAN